jgi:Domain of unknown function (DUF4158)
LDPSDGATTIADNSHDRVSATRADHPSDTAWRTSLTPSDRVQIKAASYGAFREVPTRPELERFFFLDDDDRDLIALRRTDSHRLGIALQLCTVRYV